MALFDDGPSDVERKLLKIFSDVSSTITTNAHAAGVDPAPLIEREKNDLDIASAWWDTACCKVPISKNHGTLEEYLQKDCWTNLGTELLAVFDDGKMRNVAQLDLLFYNEVTNTLWIIDGKTTAMPPRQRLSTCTIEFQTLHYMWVVKMLLKIGFLQVRFGLPKNVTLGGMMHVAILKCPLKFGREDRPFTEHDHVLKSGPRMGETEIRRTYTGEATYGHFIERQQEWYTGTGRYTDRLAEVGHEPPVNISYSHAANVLDDKGTARYLQSAAVIEQFALVEPWPCNFPMNADELRYQGGLSKYTPFFLLPVHFWPDIVKREGFVRIDRDVLIPERGHAIIKTMEASQC